MAIVSLPVAPRRALTGHATLRRPAQQGLRRDPDEDGGFAGPIPLARGRTWHSKTQAPPDPQEPVAELGGQARPNHRPRASIRKRLELGHNASVSAQESSIRRPVQSPGPGNELPTLMSQSHAVILLLQRQRRPALGRTITATPERSRTDYARI